VTIYKWIAELRSVDKLNIFLTIRKKVFWLQSYVLHRKLENQALTYVNWTTLHLKHLILHIFFFFYSSFCSALVHFQAIASLISFLQHSLFLAATVQFYIWIKSMAYLLTASSHLLLGFPTGLLPLKRPPIMFLRILKSFTLLHGQPSVISSAVRRSKCYIIITFPDLLTVSNSPHPLDLCRSEYFSEDFPLKGVNHTDSFLE
jgi:hypothetical protein